GPGRYWSNRPRRRRDRACCPRARWRGRFRGLQASPGAGRDMTAGERPTRALAVRRIGAARWSGDSVVAPGGPENRTEAEGCRGELSAVERAPAAQHTLWRGRLRRERRGLNGTAECEMKTLSRIRSRTYLSQPFRRGRREIVDSGLARSRTIVRDRPLYR